MFCSICLLPVFVSMIAAVRFCQNKYQCMAARDDELALKRWFASSQIFDDEIFKVEITNLCLVSRQKIFNFNEALVAISYPASSRMPAGDRAMRSFGSIIINTGDTIVSH